MKSYRIFSYVCLLMVLVLTSCGGDEKTELTNLNATSKSFALSTNTPNLPNSLITNTTTSGVTAAANTPANATDDNSITVKLDLSKKGPDISPYIYGLSGTDSKDPNYVSNLHPTLMRWGGNPSSRFNWVLGNAWNAGRDYDFRNGDYGQPNTDVATNSISTTLSAGMAQLITIPMIGWVARNTDQNTRSLNVPLHGGSPLSIGSQAIASYDPTANQALTSVQSKARKNAPFVEKPDPKSPVIYQDEWVASLVKRFGSAAKGGVKFYAMDNEPDLWSEVHTDVHPTRVGYDELLSRFTEYASAVKDVDPTSMVTGPVSWGWTGYFFSALDAGTDNYKTAADRLQHGNQPLIPWFLSQMHEYEQQKGKRLLDVLDIHYYPQADGVFLSKTDPETNAKRLRSTQSLWDPGYFDESWIKTQVKLIPRMQDWINTYYPGTKLGINEWNFGADNTLNGALAIDQVLGIFGSNGVYMASYWINPPANSPGYEAFKLYTNFDGKGSTFGDKSFPVQVSTDQKVNAYAAMDSKSGHLHIVLINTQPDKNQSIQVQLPQKLSAQSVPVYQLSSQTNNKLQSQSPLSISEGTSFKLTIPAYSATLLDLQPPAVN